MFCGLSNVFSKQIYIAIALLVAWLVFSLAVLLPNFSLLLQVLQGQNVGLTGKITFILSLLASIESNFTIVSATYTILIAALSGINISLFIFLVRRQQSFGGNSNSVSAVGIGGLVSGIFGMGCAACGTFILSWVLGLFSMAGFVSLLPYRGEEFGVLGVILLASSVVVTARKISKPLICEV